MNNLLWCLLIFVAATTAQATNVNAPANHGSQTFLLISFILDRQRGPWDVAFDQTFGFVFTNFSKHQFMWTADGLSFTGNVSGIKDIKRTCPVIIYQTRKSVDAAMHYFVRGCAMVPSLSLDGKTNKSATDVKEVSLSFM